MNNTPDYNDNLAFEPKDTNYDILKEYEAHNEPLPSYYEYAKIKVILQRVNILLDTLVGACEYFQKFDDESIKKTFAETKENANFTINEINEVLK